MEHSSERTVSEETNFQPVLVVDDNVVNQKVVLVLLERLGLKAVIVNNGQEAVEAIGRQKFSIVLMDCHMPDMDGFETTVAIRKLEELTGSYTPIIAVTALTMVGDRERCIAAGMDDYIPKPINRDLFKVKLTYWLQREVVYRSQKFARKYLRAHSKIRSGEDEPLDMVDLEEFYGADQLNQILEIFVKNSEEMVKRIGNHIQEQNATRVASLAHELKASSASIAAKQLSRVCLYLEQAAIQQDWSEANELLRDLTKCFQDLKDFLHEHTEVFRLG